MTRIDVLIPTFERPGPLGVTLACLIGQTFPDFRVVVSDQTEDFDVGDVRELQSVATVLRHQGRPVDVLKHLPRRGLAEQRQFLLEQVHAPYALYVDDDVILEPDLLARLHRAVVREGCGFVGSFANAPSAVEPVKDVDRLPDHVALDLWDGGVRPEHVQPGTPEWRRGLVHFAAYLHLLAARLGITKENERLYKVAWVGGCVLFDTAALRAAGGFGFWDQLPAEHCGEDALAQVRVMARAGGAGLVPSGAWHQEVPTTAPHRDVDAPVVLSLDG